MHLELQLGRSGYAVIVRLVDIDSTLVKVGVLLFAIERTGVVEIGCKQQVVMGALPGMAHTGREGDATVVVQGVAWVGFRVQIVGTQVQRGAVGPLKGFGQIKQFRAHV